MAKPRRAEAESFSKNERQKLQSLCTQSGAAFGSLRNFGESLQSININGELFFQNLGTQSLFLLSVNFEKSRSLLV